jgi:hypothetical protein
MPGPFPNLQSPNTPARRGRLAAHCHRRCPHPRHNARAHGDRGLDRSTGSGWGASSHRAPRGQAETREAGAAAVPAIERPPSVSCADRPRYVTIRRNVAAAAFCRNAPDRLFCLRQASTPFGGLRADRRIMARRNPGGAERGDSPPEGCRLDLLVGPSVRGLSIASPRSRLVPPRHALSRLPGKAAGDLSAAWLALIRRLPWRWPA